MNELRDFEHPLQKHPLNFTNVQNGSTFYSLTETESLDFLLDVGPNTLQPCCSSSSSSSSTSKEESMCTQETFPSNPTFEQLETMSIPLSVTQTDHSVEDPLQLDSSSHQTKDLSEEAQKEFVKGDETVLKSNPSGKDLSLISDIQLELASQSETKNMFVLRFSLPPKQVGARQLEEEGGAMDREDCEREQLESMLKSEAKREETTEDGFVVVSVERSKADFKLLDSMLRKKHRFCIFPYLPLESFTDRFRYRSDPLRHLLKDYERYLMRISKHPELGHSEEFLSFLGAWKDNKSWTERCNDFLGDDENRKDDIKHRIGKNLAQWARSQAAEATKELRKGLSLVFDSHHAKEIDSQESVLVRMEKIDRYLQSLETGLLSANKALEQYVDRRSSLSKLVKSLENCFHERSEQEGLKMGAIFSNVAHSFAKDIYPKSEGEEMLNIVLQDYSFLARDARRILGERLSAYEAYEKALSKYNERMRKLETLSQVSSSASNEKSSNSSSLTACAENLQQCRHFYEQAAFVTVSDYFRNASFYNILSCVGFRVAKVPIGIPLRNESSTVSTCVRTLERPHGFGEKLGTSLQTL